MPEKFQQPEIEENFYVTLNKMGYMLVKPDVINQAFIDFSSAEKSPVLDIGCAYGVSTIPTLLKGAHVIANDLDAHHLEILRSKVPLEHLGRLQIKKGRMPEDLDFPEKSLEAILASRVLNFVHPDKLKGCFSLIHKWLKPGGKFFYLGGTPFMGTFSRFREKYEENKRKNLPWPGFIEDIPTYALQRAHHLPLFINLLDEENVRKLMTDSGFRIEYINFVSAEEAHPEDMKCDGREHLGVIGVKEI